MHLLARWFPSSPQPAMTRRHTWPILQGLEDRTLMAASLCAATVFFARREKNGSQIRIGR